MADLTGDAFVKALQSENITLLVGKEQQQMTISKDLLCVKSPFVAKLVAKCDGTIDMQAESVTAVKIFIRWCYQEQLQSIQSDADPKEQNKWKRALIDVWIFAGRYGITKLQNQAMNALISLFDTSHLLTKRDVQYIWQCTSTLTTELRSLAALVLVAQIEDGNEQIKRSLEDIDEMADLEGFTSEIYTALKGWLQFQSPRTPKKDKRTKWAHFTKREEVLYLLMVEVEETPMPEPKSAEKKSCGNERKGPVEVIEID